MLFLLVITIILTNNGSGVTVAAAGATNVMVHCEGFTRIGHR